MHVLHVSIICNILEKNYLKIIYYLYKLFKYLLLINII